MNLDEKTLISKSKAGDRQAFSALVEKYQSKIINMSYGMLSDQEDAYDAAQEVFIKVFRSIDSFEEKSSFSTWIYRITVNVCNDMLRKRQRKISALSLSSTADGDEEKVLEIKDDAPTPQDTAETNETQLEVRRAISELSDEYKTVITLFDLEGLSYDEISSIINVPVGTVKSRLSRARSALKKNLLKKRELFLK